VDLRRAIFETSLKILASMPLALLVVGIGCSGSCTVPAPSAPAPAASAVTEDPALEARLRAALDAKGPDYVPRTRHKTADGRPRFTNRLILESSPYLLQHAHNPVQWFPWGDEAFERARALGRPIFLSIGYSTCHWCHVMEEESFEDEEIAAYLNEHYVAIKVDREERPDLDAVYMSFVQAFTGSGGWPMNVWLTPEKDPFFGGTYFPPRAGARGSRRGLLEILREQSNRYVGDPANVAQTARGVAEKLGAAATPEPAGDLPTASLLPAAGAQAARRFDPEHGGTRGAPKFPSSFPVRLLLRIARRTGDTAARQMAVSTLEHMRAGGVYDQVGGGFHRYSTDADWLVPHFEKMLYDNASLALTYLEGAEATGDVRFVATSRETLDYLLREMTAPDGTFYSATDADSPGDGGRRAEGVFFTWTPAELRATLGDADAKVAALWFGVTQVGNFEGRSVLTARRSLDEAAKELSLDPKVLDEKLENIRARLLEARSHRPPPLRDDKVIVAWNALAISAFARAAITLGEPRYADAAIKAARTLVAPLRAGRPLPHSLVAGKEGGVGFADDYAFLASALLDVFELTSDVAWLDDARQLMAELERSFADGSAGGYFLTADVHERLLVRTKSGSDGPIPTPSSVAAMVWLRLYALTDDDVARQRAERTLRAFSQTLTSHPLALDQMLLALDWATEPTKEIVVVVPDGGGALSPRARPLLDGLRRTFVPNGAFVIATPADLDGALSHSVPWAKDKAMKSGAPTAFVCEGGTCKLPTTDPEVFAAQLSELRAYPL